MSVLVSVSYAFVFFHGKPSSDRRFVTQVENGVGESNFNCWFSICQIPYSSFSRFLWIAFKVDGESSATHTESVGTATHFDLRRVLSRLLAFTLHSRERPSVLQQRRCRNCSYPVPNYRYHLRCIDVGQKCGQSESF